MPPEYYFQPVLYSALFGIEGSNQRVFLFIFLSEKGGYFSKIYSGVSSRSIEDDWCYKFDKIPICRGFYQSRDIHISDFVNVSKFTIESLGYELILDSREVVEKIKVPIIEETMFIDLF